MRYLRQAALLLLSLSQAYGQPGGKFSTVVRVAGWDTAGGRVPRIRVVLSSLVTKEEYTADGRDVQLSVPTGEYLLQVGAVGFQAKRQVLKAYQPAVFRSVELPLAWIHGQAASGLTGTVQNYSGDIRDLRVRLMGLYGDTVWEAVPDAQGAFKFPADAGTYLLVVVADLDKGAAVVDSQPVRIPFTEQVAVTVDLKGKRAAPIPQAEL